MAKVAVKLLLQLLPVVITSSNVNLVLDAVLAIIRDKLGTDSMLYDLLERIVRRAQEHGCLAELADTLAEFVSDRFGAVGYNIGYVPALQSMAGDLDSLRAQCQAD